MLQYSAALFPQMSPDIPRNRLTVSMLQQELSTVLISHFSVARCIASIMANTSLVSETLLTKHAILSNAYIHVSSYYTHVNNHVFFYGILQHLEPSFHVISITEA